MDNITPVELPPFPIDLRVSLEDVAHVKMVCEEIEDYARAAVLADRARMASAGAVPEGFWLAPMMLDVTMLHAMGDTPGMKAMDSAVSIHQARGYPCNPKAFEGGAPLAQAWVAGRDSWLSRHTTPPAAQVGTSGASAERHFAFLRFPEMYGVPAVKVGTEDADAPVNHTEAYQLACLKRADSNLARCYIELHDAPQPLEAMAPAKVEREALTPKQLMASCPYSTQACRGAYAAGARHAERAHGIPGPAGEAAKDAR